jgi:hypothetical protein
VTKCKDNGEGLDPVNGDGSFCHKKMVVAITVRSGQGNVEALHADIKAVEDENEDMQPLQKPYRIFLEKTQVDIRYPLVYEKVDSLLLTDKYLTVAFCYIECTK